MTLSNQEILNVVKAEAANTIGTSDTDSELGQQRSRAIDYYHGKMDDIPPLEGWSRVTTREVFETIESAMPDIMEIFAASEDFMEFIPEGEDDDVARARQETDVVNYVFHQQNSGFLVLYTYIKDALQAKNGFVKVDWQERSTDEVENYSNISDEDLAVLQADDDLNIDDDDIETTTEKTGDFLPTITVVDGQPQIGKGDEIIIVTHNVVANRKKDASGVKIQAIAPEELAVSREAKSLQTAALVRHTPRDVTRSSLLEIGIERSKVDQLTTIGIPDTEEEIARDTLDQDIGTSSVSDNFAMQKIEAIDNYIRIDMNGNGKAELWHIMTGNKDTVVLSKTRIERVPVSTMTPIIEPHQLFGISLADLVIDLQRINTFLTRAAVDNAALQNNQRPVISEAGAAASTVDDVLMNRPGSPILVRGSVRDAFTYAPNNNIAGDMISLVQHFDNVRDKRTGIVRGSQGIDPDAIRKDISATEFAGQQSNLLKTVRLIARIFAETGIKDMMINVHHALQSHSGNKEIAFRLNGKFEMVNPREWKTRTDMQINVGLGTGTKAEQIGQLGQILSVQREAYAQQEFKDGPLVTLKQIRYTLSRITILQGFKSADAFFEVIPDDFKQEEKEPAPNPALMKVQLDAQNDAEKNRIQEENNIREAEMKQNNESLDRQVKIFQISQELELKAKGQNAEIDLKTDIAKLQLFLKNKQIELDAETRGTSMGIKAALDLDGVSADITPTVRVGGDIAG